ncbi:MAG: hypothetical protein ABL932_07605 [Terricaulis sp.]
MQQPDAASNRWFFVAMALVAVAVALTGFATTFFIPLASGRFEAPPVIYAHAIATFSWIGLFVLQPTLIRRGAYNIHVRTGILGVLIAVTVAVTGLRVGIFASARDFAAGGGAAAISSFLGVVTSMTMFLGLVGAAIAFRAKPETHKRLMLLATIIVLWPAWFRFRHYFPGVPNPEIWFAVVAADSLILVAALRDFFVLGRVHPVWLYAGTAVILEQSLEVIFFDSPLWRAAAQALYAALS